MKFLKSLDDYVNFKNFSEKIGFYLSLFLLASFLINVGSILYTTKAPRAVVAGTDNDAGHGIQTVMLTRWYNSNHFGPYGNLYYRFAHTLAKITPVPTYEDFGAVEADEMTHHFAMMVTNLLCLASLCWFLSCLTLQGTVNRLLVTNLLLHLSLYDPTWVYYVFRAHPDHLLMLFTMISSYFTLKYMSSNQRRDFILAALMWGVATAVKRSTVLFIPSFLFMFLYRDFSKNGFKKGFEFIGYMLLSYLVVGFPQNFGFYKHLSFMLGETRNSRSANLDSIIEYLNFIFSQMRYLVVGILAFHLLAGKREKVINWKFIVFSLIAIVSFLSSRMITPHQHHVMPLVGLLFITLLYVIKLIPSFSFKNQKVVVFGIALLSLFAFSELPNEVHEQQKYQFKCRKENFAILKMVKEFQKNEDVKLGRDPYFPFISANKHITKQYWGANLRRLDEEKIQLYGTRESFGRRFLVDSPHKLNPEELALHLENREFYQLVFNETAFTTPNGRKFHKIYEDSCGYSMWLLEGLENVIR